MTANEAGKFLVKVAIARRELIAECIQDPVVHLVGAVRVGGMQLWADVGGVVVEQIEHVMALVFVSAEDGQVERHVVSDGGVCADTLVEAEVFGRMASLEGIELGLEALAVTA